MEDFLERPVFICGAARSGSTLFCDLPDGRSGLLPLPTEDPIQEFFNRMNHEEAAGKVYGLQLNLPRQERGG